MSRIGKAPVSIPKGVEIKVVNRAVHVKGPKGQLEFGLPESVDVKTDGGLLKVVALRPEREFRKFHGLARAMLRNMIEGVSVGFTKQLSLVGIGYKVAASGKGITLNLGYSHTIDFEPPKGITLKVDKQAIEIFGIDRQQVGQVAAKIRGFRPPEPYHGKGVRYSTEHVKTKVGKAAVKGATA